MTGSLPCPLCSQPSLRRHAAQPGYQSPREFAIYHCDDCQTAFAQPLEVDPAVYEAIYRSFEATPGYARYGDYSREVTFAVDPLGHLAEREDVYWGIRQYIDSKAGQKLKILEIGSGLGYLTYSLSKRGHDAVGLEVSQTAVDAATKCYGPHYRCGELVAYSKTSGEKYDLVVATELIEHVPDVRAFMAAAVLLLRPGGDLVLTTPNRSAYPAEVLWETEPPPVHLWWFSEKAIEALGKELGLVTTFVDFTPYNLLDPTRPLTDVTDYQPTRGSVLDPAGNAYMGYSKRLLLKMGLRPALRTIRHVVRRATHKLSRGEAGNRRRVLCAVMHQQT